MGGIAQADWLRGEKKIVAAEATHVSYVRSPRAQRLALLGGRSFAFEYEYKVVPIHMTGERFGTGCSRKRSDCSN